MVDVKDSLTGKIGPLPVYAWALIVAAPIIGIRIVSQRKAAAAAAAAASAAAAADAGTGVDSVPDGQALTPSSVGTGLPPGSLYAAGNPGGIYDYSSTSGAGSTATTYNSNSAWLNAAADMLVSQDGLSPSIVLSALRKVINGDPITTTEEAIFNQAVRKAGNPPDGIPTISRQAETAPTATVPQTPTAPAVIGRDLFGQPVYAGGAVQAGTDTNGNPVFQGPTTPDVAPVANSFG